MKKICFCLLMGLCFTVSAEPLNKQQVEIFADKLVKALLTHPKEMIQYFSDSVVVEKRAGSSLNGATFKYNKQEFAKVLQNAKHPISDQRRYGKLRLHDVVVHNDVGEFSMSVYVKRGKYKGWFAFSVVQNDKKIEIIKLVVEI